MEKQVKELSKTAVDRSEKIEESVYTDKLMIIDAAYNYLEKKLSDKKESRSTDLSIRFMFGFISGMIFGLSIVKPEIFMILWKY